MSDLSAKGIEDLGSNDHDYEAGFRDGRIQSLEQTVENLTKDVSILNKAVYLLYGAIAIVQFVLPMLEKASVVVK